MDATLAVVVPRRRHVAGAMHRDRSAPWWPHISSASFHALKPPLKFLPVFSASHASVFVMTVKSYFCIGNSGELTGAWRLEPPTCVQGHPWDLCKTDEKFLGKSSQMQSIIGYSRPTKLCIACPGTDLFT